ncbi:MAG: hypothetical protein M3Y49_09750 [Actinomycetota bacterium]|nr:hypothetical protein [Actinomycetota bacterium]
MSVRIAASVVAVACTTAAFGAIAPSAAHAATPPAVTATGTYRPISPARIADSFSGLGGHKTYVSRNNTVTYTVAGKSGIPAKGVSSVVVQLTAFDQHGNGAFVAYPAGAKIPAAVSFAYGGRSAQEGRVTVPVSSTGQISVRGAGAYQAHLRIDVVGWFASASSTAAAGSLYLPSDLTLQDDTRITRDRLKPGDSLEEDFQIGFGSNDPSFVAPKVMAMDLNLTAINPSGKGGLIAWSGSGAKPWIPSLQFSNKDSVSSSVIVPLTLVSAQTQDGMELGTYKFAVTAYGGSTDVALSVGGYYTQGTDAFGAVYSPSTPQLAVNSITGKNITKGRLGGDLARTANLPSSAYGQNTIAVNMTTAAVAPTANTSVAQTTNLLAIKDTQIITTLAGATRSGALTAQLDGGINSTAPQVGFYNASGSIDIEAWTYGRFNFNFSAMDSAAKRMTPQKALRHMLDQRPTVRMTHKIIRAN